MTTAAWRSATAARTFENTASTAEFLNGPSGANATLLVAPAFRFEPERSCGPGPMAAKVVPPYRQGYITKDSPSLSVVVKASGPKIKHSSSYQGWCARWKLFGLPEFLLSYSAPTASTTTRSTQFEGPLMLTTFEPDGHPLPLRDFLVSNWS